MTKRSAADADLRDMHSATSSSPFPPLNISEESDCLGISQSPIRNLSSASNEAETRNSGSSLNNRQDVGMDEV